MPDRPESPAATPVSEGLDKLDAVREWVREGIPKTLDSEGGEFMLGIESASVIDALDYIEGYILNLEADQIALRETIKNGR